MFKFFIEAIRFDTHELCLPLGISAYHPMTPGSFYVIAKFWLPSKRNVHTEERRQTMSERLD